MSDALTDEECDAIIADVRAQEKERTGGGDWRRTAHKYALIRAGYSAGYAAGQAAIAERCAVACDEVGKEHWNARGYVVADFCAARCRALGTENKPG